MAQPETSFGGEELYPDLASKAAALGHSLIQNHPFVDGNKRVGHAATEAFLLLKGCELMYQLMSRRRQLSTLEAVSLRVCHHPGTN